MAWVAPKAARAGTSDARRDSVRPAKKVGGTGAVSRAEATLHPEYAACDRRASLCVPTHNEGGPSVG